MDRSERQNRDDESWSRCASPGTGRARKGAEGRACSGTRRAERPHAREATLTAAANHRAHRSVHTKSGIEDVVSLPFSACVPSGCSDAPNNETCAENTTCSAQQSRYTQEWSGVAPEGREAQRSPSGDDAVDAQAVRKRRLADLHILAGRPRQWLGLAGLPGAFSASAPPFFFGLGGGVDLGAELRANKHTHATGRSGQHRWCNACAPASRQFTATRATRDITANAFGIPFAAAPL